MLEGPSASEVGKEIAEHREHATAEHAQRDRRVAIVEAVPLSWLCWPRGRVLGRQVGHGIVAFSGERFSGGEPSVGSQPSPVRPGTPRGLLWKSMSRRETSAEKDER